MDVNYEAVIVGDEGRGSVGQVAVVRLNFVLRILRVLRLRLFLVFVVSTLATYLISNDTIAEGESKDAVAEGESKDAIVEDTRISSVVGSLQKYEESSFVECQNGVDEDGSDPVCHFQNVCWDRVKMEFAYFDNPSRSTIFLTVGAVAAEAHPRFTTKKHLRYFLMGLVNLRRIEPGHERRLPIRVENGTIPNIAIFHNASTHVLYEPFWPENFGHAIIDDVFPVYVLMKLFDLYTTAVQVLTINNICGVLMAGWDGSLRHSSECKRAHHIVIAYMGLISNRSIIEMVDIPGFKHISSPLSFPARYTCIRNLLVGHSKTGIQFQGKHFSSGFIDQMLKTAATRWGDVATAIREPLKKHSILVLEKKGRRHVLNHNALIHHLLYTFPEATVSSVDPSTLTMSESIILAQSTTVLFTPCGGISFFALFMRSQATAIFMGYWDTHLNASAHMEAHIWSQIERIQALYYDVRKEDVIILLPGDAVRGNWEDYRDFGSFHVDLERSSTLIDSALRRSDHLLMPGL